jgi:hypothetical protein
MCECMGIVKRRGDLVISVRCSLRDLSSVSPRRAWLGAAVSLDCCVWTVLGTAPVSEAAGPFAACSLPGDALPHFPATGYVSVS